MGGGSKKSTTEVDPYKNMPGWLKDAYQQDIDWRNNFLDEAQELAGNTTIDPRRIAGLDPRELQALRDAGVATDKAGGITESAIAMLPELAKFRGVEGLGELGPVAGPAAEFGDIANPDGTFTRAAGPEDVDIDALRTKYESGYTDDVVSTTLAGMDRTAQREALRREAANAAIGGTSNTRQAVADAVAGQLTGESKAKTEAQLRDQAFRTASEFGLQEAAGTRGFNLARSEFEADQNDAERSYGLDLANFGLSEEQAKRAYDMQRAGFSLEEALARTGQENLSREFDASQEAARRAYDLDRAGLEFDSAKLTADLGQQDYLRRFGLAGLTGSVGETNRGIKQARRDAAFENQGKEMDEMSWLANLFTGTNTKGTTPQSQSTTSTQPGPSAFSQIAGLAATATGAFLASDERVKDGIVSPDESALDKLDRLDGRREYRYRDGYGHTRERTTGLMAQDLEKAGIEGAVVDIDGVKHVDPYPLLATVVDAVRELRAERKTGAGL